MITRIREVRRARGMTLDDVAKAIDEGFAKFEKEGVSEKDLTRIKAGQETQFYNSLSSVLGKGVVLAQYNIFAGDPGFVEKDIKNILAVTSADVMRAFHESIREYGAGGSLVVSWLIWICGQCVSSANRAPDSNTTSASAAARLPATVAAARSATISWRRATAADAAWRRGTYQRMSQ